MKNLSDELKDKLSTYRETLSVIKQRLNSDELSEIEGNLSRLEELKLTISAFGETNAGKSALLNSLLGYDNEDPENCPFVVNENINFWSEEIEENNRIEWKEVQGIELIVQDTPGIAGDFSEHLDKARKYASNSDVVLYVIWQTLKGSVQSQAIQELISANKPLIIVINQIDRQRPREIEATKKHLLSKFPELTDDVFVLAAGHPTNGMPIITDLVGKIIQIVESQHNELIVNTVELKLGKGVDIAAARIKEQVRQEQEQRELELARKEAELFEIEDSVKNVIGWYALGASAAAALIPFGIDALTTTLVSSGMFVHILKKYKKKLDTSAIYQVGSEMLNAFFQILAVSGLTLAAYLAISKGAKTNPITYVAGMTLDGIFTYFIVYTIGEAFSFYCKNDLTWGHHEVARRAMVEFIKKNVDEMFLDKLPKKFRDVIKIDKDKLK